MPMILVKKNPRGKVIRELSSEEETAVKTVCGLKKPATMAQHNLANDLLREMREYDAWLQCDCIPGDSPAMNFAALKNNTGTLYLSSFNHEHAPECPMYRQLSGNDFYSCIVTGLQPLRHFQRIALQAYHPAFFIP